MAERTTVMMISFHHTDGKRTIVLSTNTQIVYYNKHTHYKKQTIESLMYLIQEYPYSCQPTEHTKEKSLMDYRSDRVDCYVLSTIQSIDDYIHNSFQIILFTITISASTC